MISVVTLEQAEEMKERAKDFAYIQHVQRHIHSLRTIHQMIYTERNYFDEGVDTWKELDAAALHIERILEAHGIKRG